MAILLMSIICILAAEPPQHSPSPPGFHRCYGTENLGSRFDEAAKKLFARIEESSRRSGASISRLMKTEVIVISDDEEDKHVHENLPYFYKTVRAHTVISRRIYDCCD